MRAGALPRVLAVAAFLAGSLLGVGAAGQPARAAEDGLALVSSATYQLDPEAGVVRVTIDLTATNTKPNTTAGGTTTRYYYEGATIAIHGEASGVRATSGGSRLATSLDPDDGFTVLEIDFRRDLFYKQSAAIRITYDLPGGAPRSTSDIRVGPAFATFYAWAFGDSGDVRILLPTGFEEDVTGSTLTRSEGGGVTTLAATDIVDPTEWYAVVVADRQASLTHDLIDLPGENDLVVRAWPNDEEWRTRVGDLLSDGLPVLTELIGLEWPVDDDLEVFEVHTPLLEGYAGFFIALEDRIEISEDLDDLTILHEASHAWFNTDIFSERWIYEGFADEYAALALEEVGDGGWRPDAVDPSDRASVRLNEWRHPGRIEDDETDARERFGYEASWTVIRELVDEIGVDAMRRVIAAAEARRVPDVGAGQPERISGRVDWRRFLDLLEVEGESATAEELYREWIVSDEETTALDERSATRAAYADLLEASDGWQPPFAIREVLAQWEFDTATERIDAARSILATRDDVAAVAGRLGLVVPPSLRAAYEHATTDFDEARELADEQLAAIQAIEAASGAVTAERDPFVAIGLIGAEPEAELTTVRAAFEAADDDAAAAAAADLATLMSGAADVGRTRTAQVGGIGGGLVLVGGGAIVLARRRRRRAAESRSAAAWSDASAGPSLPVGPDAPAVDSDETRPYATLADQPGSSAPPAAWPSPPDPSGPVGEDRPGDSPGPPPADDRSDAS